MYDVFRLIKIYFDSSNYYTITFISINFNNNYDQYDRYQIHAKTQATNPIGTISIMLLTINIG